MMSLKKVRTGKPFIHSALIIIALFLSFAKTDNLWAIDPAQIKVYEYDPKLTVSNSQSYLEVLFPVNIPYPAGLTETAEKICSSYKPVEHSEGEGCGEAMAACMSQELKTKLSAKFYECSGLMGDPNNSPYTPLHWECAKDKYKAIIIDQNLTTPATKQNIFSACQAQNNVAGPEINSDNAAPPPQMPNAGATAPIDSAATADTADKADTAAAVEKASGCSQLPLAEGRANDRVKLVLAFGVLMFTLCKLRKGRA